jgi:hypothetical protein
MKYANPTIDEFKAYWTRDFPYSTDPAEGVTDTDIAKCFTQANFSINQNLFASQEDYTTAYMLLAAHYLVLDIRLATQGLNSTYQWAVSSRSVGAVSESYSIPTNFQNNPFLTMLSQTGYGGKYLALLLPLMHGNVLSIQGQTLP